MCGIREWDSQSEHYSDCNFRPTRRHCYRYIATSAIASSKTELSLPAADEDYSSVSESLEFTPGTSQLCVDLVITDDAIGEDSETLTCTLSTGPSATVTIMDNGSYSMQSLSFSV